MKINHIEFPWGIKPRVECVKDLSDIHKEKSVYDAPPGFVQRLLPYHKKTTHNLALA